MRTIKRASQLKKDYKGELKGLHANDLVACLTPILTALVSDRPLDDIYRDHRLIGD